MSDYKTIRTDGQGEIIEKKSRFIGEVHYAKDLSEAESFLTAARKKYYDARHHCFACIVGAPGTPDEILRSNDDGEPGGTAGKPMLEVLTGEGLHYAAAVVTRYFGGTLLGTGGLVRAYTAAVRGESLYGCSACGCGKRGHHNRYSGIPPELSRDLSSGRQAPVCVCKGAAASAGY